MSARGLRAAADRAQREWASTLDLVAQRHARSIAQIDDPLEALTQTRRLLATEGRRAQQLGASQVAGIVRAAGQGPAAAPVVPPPTAPADLGRRVAADWRAAAQSGDPRAFREGRMRRVIDQALQVSHDDGALAALEATQVAVGYRRIARGGCCGACLALIDGRVHRTSDAFPRHPFCRCQMEPVIAGVNVDDAGRPTAQERWEQMSSAEQDAMFAGHGGSAKADLIRAGHIDLEDLVADQPRRPGERPLSEEASLEHLRLVATERRLLDRGLLDTPTVIGEGMTPAERTRALRDALREAAEATWARPTADSWALDPHFGYRVTVPDRIFGKVARSHPEVMAALGITDLATPSPRALAALRSATLMAVGRATRSAAGNRPTRREHYLEDGIEISPGRPRWLVAIVEFQGIEGEAFNLYAGRKPPRRVRDTQ